MIGELLNFPHNKDNTGIMRFLFRRDDYWNLFRIYSSGAYSEEYKEENAFDFSTSDYWLGKMQSTPTYISFCFNNYSVKPIGYDITASTFAARPRRWAFSGSKDNSTWNFYEEKKRDSHELSLLYEYCTVFSKLYFKNNSKQSMNTKREELRDDFKRSL